jgi:hypothetical protein
LYKYEATSRKVGKAAPVQGCASTHIIQVIGTDLLTCCIESRHIRMMLKSQFLTRPNLPIYKIIHIYIYIDIVYMYVYIYTLIR